MITAASNSEGAFLKPAIVASFVKLDPRTLMKNPVMFTVELVAGASVRSKVSHGGKEGFFVLAGDVEIEVGDQIFRLRPGDYLEFPANLRHATQSRSARATVLVIVGR